MSPASKEGDNTCHTGVNVPEIKGSQGRNAIALASLDTREGEGGRESVFCELLPLVTKTVATIIFLRVIREDR